MSIFMLLLAVLVALFSASLLIVFAEDLKDAYRRVPGWEAPILTVLILAVLIVRSAPVVVEILWRFTSIVLLTTLDFLMVPLMPDATVKDVWKGLCDDLRDMYYDRWFSLYEVTRVWRTLL